jgi:hypothetical protein
MYSKVTLLYALAEDVGSILTGQYEALIKTKKARETQSKGLDDTTGAGSGSGPSVRTSDGMKAL